MYCTCSRRGVVQVLCLLDHVVHHLRSRGYERIGVHGDPSGVHRSPQRRL
jgi:hypothetical protein